MAEKYIIKNPESFWPFLVEEDSKYLWSKNKADACAFSKKESDELQRLFGFRTILLLA